MKRRVPSFALFALALGLLACTSTKVQAQSFTGKWIHEGPKGMSVLEFFPGEKKIIGPTRGRFHHSLVLDDGRVVEGDGTYVFRSVLPNRGLLVLHFADGHVTREHEHTIDSHFLRIEHHGLIRTYVRQ
jgi:hypothetical protein